MKSDLSDLSGFIKSIIMAIPLKWWIPGIHRIYVIPARQLPEDLDSTDDSAMIAIGGLPSEMEFYDVPVCEVTEIHSRAGVEYKVSLDFTAATSLPFREPAAFIVTDNDGRSTLIGHREPPHPEVETRSNTGDFKGRRGVAYSITSIVRPVAVLV